jgi:NAD(P)-dependent dehydrogenase (short-subunit alcohol dehydrogenase family)
MKTVLCSENLSCWEGQRMQTVLITGASRGIGLAFVRAYLQRGDLVFATCRYPSTATHLHQVSGAYPQQLRIVALDIASVDSISACYQTLQHHTAVVDLLINNAGIITTEIGSTDRLGTLDFDAMTTMLQVNALGALFVVQAVLPLLRASSAARVINLSSWYGSISGRTADLVSNYGYATSKAALNMVTRSLAFDLQAEGISVLALDPGWVQTDMGGREGRLTPEQAVEKMVKVIDQSTLAQSGQFFRYDGQVHQW